MKILHFYTSSLFKAMILFCCVISSQVVMAQSESDSLRSEYFIGKIREFSNKDASIAKVYLDSMKAEVVGSNEGTYIEAAYYKLLGIYLYRKSQYDSSLLAYKRSALLYGQSNYPLDQAKILVNTSMNFNKIGMYDSAIDYALRSNRAFQELGDSKGVGVSYNIVGQVFFNTGNYLKAKEYFLKYVENANERSDVVEQASGYINLGAAYRTLKNFDSAYYYQVKAIDFAKQVGNKYSIGNAYQNVGSALKSLKRYEEAIQYYDSALTLYRDLDYDDGALLTAENLGMLYLELKEYQKAETYFVEAMDWAEMLKLPRRKMEIALYLSIIYRTQEKYKEAYPYLADYVALSDSILNIDKQATIEELNTQFETEKKEQEIVLLNRENALKEASLERNTFLIAGLVLLVIVLILAFILIRNRTAQQHKQVLQEQKIRMRETQMQAVIDSQEQERKRFATDLHDGMGQLISALQLNIQSMKAAGDDLEKRDTLYGNSSQLLKDVHKEIRNIAFNLMPQTLVKEGLEAAIKELTRKINQTDGITLHPTFTDFNGRLKEVQEVSIYRIIQELLSNIMKYSQAKNVYIGLTGYDDEVVVSIEDDGIGYDLDAFKNSEGNGWRNISSRISLVKGFIEINTRPGGKGSSVMMEIPRGVQVKNKIVHG